MNHVLLEEHGLPRETAWRRSSAILVALFWTGLSFWLIGDLYLNLRDEGYLWYGVQALGRGELPFRDFQSYDPGRYLWCYLWSQVFGEHVIGMRAGLAIFQGIGLSFGLVCARRLFGNPIALACMGLLLILWMFPRFKIFEASITLVGVWSLMRLLETPDRRRFAAAGLCLGLAAFFGRNHGLYLGLANLGLFAHLAWRSRALLSLRRLASWCLGVLVGYGPMLWMLVSLPDFRAAFWRELLATSKRGANVPLDFPWPWSFDPSGLEGVELSIAWVEQSAFLLPLVALPLALWVLLRTRAGELRERAVLVAAAWVALPYSHHFAVRSDLPHLAQAMAPLLLVLLGALSYSPKTRRWPRHGLLALCLVQALALGFLSHPTLKSFGPGVVQQELEPFEVGGCTLRLKSSQARHLFRVRAMVEKYVPRDEPMFIAPTRTTFYPLFEKATPVWWIYFLFQNTEAEQRAVIEGLRQRQVRWALIDEKSFAKDEAFDFDNTNPLVWAHLLSEWELIRDPIVPPDYFLFRRR